MRLRFLKFGLNELKQYLSVLNNTKMSFLVLSDALTRFVLC
jgi:hypothetical protein